jgi:hypothetical protein
MSLFDRFRAKPEPPPEWGEILSPQAFSDFMDLLAQDLAGRGIRYEIDRQEGVIRAEPSPGDKHSYGLGNLVQQCARLSKRRWKETIKCHFDIIINGHADAQKMLETLFEDFNKVGASLRVRLYPDDMQLNAKLVSRPVASGLVAALVIDLPETVVTVTPDAVQKWPLSEDELFGLAKENVRAERLPTPELVTKPPAPAIYGVHTQSHFVASWMLMLEDVLPPDLPHGAIVSAPTRHLLLWHVIQDREVETAMKLLAGTALMASHAGPGSISPRIYWWQGGRFLPIGVQVNGDSMEIAPPDEFLFQVLSQVR